MAHFRGVCLALALLLAATAYTADARPVSISGRSLLQGASPPSTDPIIAAAMSVVMAETAQDVAAFIAGTGNATYEANLIADAIANASLTALSGEAAGTVYTDANSAVQAVSNAINNAFISAVASGSNNNPQYIAGAQSAGLNTTLAALLLATPPATAASTGKAGEPKSFPTQQIPLLGLGGVNAGTIAAVGAVAANPQAVAFIGSPVSALIVKNLFGIKLG